MTVIRKFAVQGHAIPSIVHSPRGPFPSEILVEPQRTVEPSHQDSLHVGLDDVRFFKCRDCDSILITDELDEHECLE